MKNEDVMKALTPEETTMLSNIQSIIGEIIGQNQTNEAPVGEAQMAVVQKENNMSTTDDMEEKIDDKVEKEMVTSESDAATASDDAETRIDENQTEEAEDAVNEVAKALAQVLQVKKSQDKKPVNPIVDAIGQIANVQKATQDQINEISTALSQIIKGMGIAEQMEVAKSQIEKKNNDKPIYSQDMEKVFKDLFASLKNDSKKEEVTGRQSNNDIIRKNLSDPNFLRQAIANKY